MIVPLEGVRPAPRTDGEPWTSADVQGSTAQAGPWTTLATVLLVPLDTNPADPTERTFTVATDDAALTWFRVEFVDDAGNRDATPPVQNTRPSPTEVLAATETLMAYRLRQGGFAVGQGGTDVASFTSNTTPTLERAKDVAARQATAVAREFGTSPADMAAVIEVAALRAAIELELSVPSPDYERVREWRNQLREYVQRADAAADGDDGLPGEGEAERALAPVWDFGPGELARAEGSEDAVAASSTLSPRRLRW